MTRRTRTCAGLAALGLFFACVSSGYAADVVYHGSLCNPIQEQVGQVLYDQRGIANLSSFSPLVVACGGAIWIGPLINRVSVIVYDRNPVADVVCTLVLVDIFGVPFSTSSASSSGSQADFQELRFAPGVRTDTISLQCTIPAATASGVSHLTTYRVISTP